MKLPEPKDLARPIDDDLVDALVQSSFTTMAVLSKIAAEYELSLTQLRVFGILRDRRLKMSALADFLGLEKSTMSGLIDRAEKRGLVTREANANDGRSVEVFLTPQGEQLASQVHARVATLIISSTLTLTHAERNRLHGLLVRTLDPLEP